MRTRSIGRRASAGFAWACLVVLGVLACRSEPPPNLILLIGDDQSYRDFGFSGSSHAQTPRLDELAAAGTVFRIGYSTASVCRPALLSLLTGLYPLEYGVRLDALARESGQPAPPPPRPAIQQLETLPRALARRGYVSFQAGKYFEGSYADAGFSEGMVRSQSRDGWGLVRKGSEPVYEFLERNRERPFFVWFAPKLPHTPHTPPERLLARYREADLPPHSLGYFASVSWFDEAVGELVDRLEALGLRERTLLVYVVDNGWVSGAPPGSYLYHLGGPKGKESLYEEGFRTPVLFNWPGHVPAGVVRDDLVSFVDLFPTLLSYAGAAAPQGLSGIDLRPAIERGTPVPRKA